MIGHINPKYAQAGRWWHKEQEIGIVALNDQAKDILYAECKWKKGVKPREEMEKLTAKTEYVDWFKGQRNEEYALFAKTYTKKITEYEGKKITCYDLSDLEAIRPKKRDNSPKQEIQKSTGQ
jgi:uncharacterized protein